MGIDTNSDTPYARGDADRYYGRPYDPHKRDAKGNWLRDLTEEERAEYARGFDDNLSVSTR